MTTFESPLADLARAGAEFIVVGGLAVAQAGHVRMTEDIDLLVESSEANLSRLIDALAARGDGAAAELTTADFPDEEGAVRVIEDFVFDLFTQMSGHTYADFLPLSVQRDVLGQPVRFLGIDGLLRLKSPSLREKDQLDAAALRRIAEGDGTSQP